METFSEPKELVENRYFPEQRRKTLAALSDDMVDGPIVALIRDLNSRPYCFTLQACWGHFMHAGQPDPRNLAPLPLSDLAGEVEYRIAYIVLCFANSAGGKELFAHFEQLPLIDPDYIQLGCADWFWERQVNSYALQVEPDRFKDKDKITLDYREAVHVEKVRNAFFARLQEMLSVLPG